MRTFSTTEARNRFGEFLDAGMVERVKLVRNNRVIGYFLPERDYAELMRTQVMQQKLTRQLTGAELETLTLYSQGKIGASEAKASMACNYRELISMLAQRNLPLPHVNLVLANKMASEVLEIMNIPVVKQVTDNGSIQGG